eukprot:contig_12553_g3006
MVLKILDALPDGYNMFVTVLENAPPPWRLTPTMTKLMNTEKKMQLAESAAPTSSGGAYSGTANPETPLSKTPKNPGKRTVKCYYCKNGGDYIHECRIRKADEIRVQANGEQRGGASGAEAMGFAAQAGSTKRGGGDPTKWLVDSGATHHMTPGKGGEGTFVVTEPGAVREITLASGDTVPVVGQGRATLKAKGHGEVRPLTLEETLCVPDLEENLLSVGAVDKKGGGSVFVGGRVYLFKDAEKFVKSGILKSAGAVGHMDERGHYMLGASSAAGEAEVASTTVKGAPALWHRRTFHRALSTLAKAAKVVDGMPLSEVQPDGEAGAVCAPCAKSKIRIRSDGAGEYKTRKLKEWYAS